MSNQRPTLYLSNWSSHRTPGCHGPGRKLTIMAAPRAWEHGEGRVVWLTPDERDLRDAKAERISVDVYRERFETFARLHLGRGHLAPGELITTTADGSRSVEDGDTLCCACSRDEAAAGRCHRAWAAPLLVAAGWRVVLDGEEVPGV